MFVYDRPNSKLSTNPVVLENVFEVAVIDPVPAVSTLDVAPGPCVSEIAKVPAFVLIELM